MKRWLFWAMIVTIVSGLVPASAEADDLWVVDLLACRKYVKGQAVQSMGQCVIGTGPDKSDEYVPGEDVPYSPRTDMDYGLAEIDIQDHAQDAGTRVRRDFRAPLTAGNVKFWNLRCYVVGESSGDFYLLSWVPTGAVIDTSNLTVSAYEGVVTPSNYLSQTPIWEFGQGISGTQTSPNYTGFFSYTGGYKEFTIVAQAVPEPGSAIALLTGISGILCFKRGHRRS